MRLLYFIVFILLFNNPGLEEISRYIRTNNIKKLSEHFDGDVDIIIEDFVDDTFNKEESFIVLDKFFGNGVKSFNILNDGYSRDRTSLYCVGKLVINDDNFRATIFLKSNDEKLIIKEIRIDKD